MSECIVFKDTGHPQQASFQVNSEIEWVAIRLKLGEAQIKLNKTELVTENTNNVIDTWYTIELADVVEQSITFQVLDENSNVLCKKDIRTDYDDSYCDSKINLIYEQFLQDDGLVSEESNEELLEKLKELQNEDNEYNYYRYYRWRTNSTCYRTQLGKWTPWPSDSPFTELSYNDVFAKSKMTDDDKVKICVESTAHYEMKFVEVLPTCGDIRNYTISSTVFFLNVKKPDDSNPLVFLCSLLLLVVVGAFLYWRIKNEKADIADVLRRIFYKWSSQDPMPKLVLIDDENVQREELLGEGNFGYVFKER